VRGAADARSVGVADDLQATKRRDNTMAQGTVKYFNEEKGYGFITPDSGGQDLFVHYSAITASGYRVLEAGSGSSTTSSRARGDPRPPTCGHSDPEPVTR
jgi:cold shock CspA family protein